MRDPLLTRPRRTRDALAALGALVLVTVAVHAVLSHAFSWIHPLGMVIGAALLAFGGRDRIPAAVRGVATATVGVVLAAIGIGLAPHVADRRVAVAAVSIALIVGGLVLMVLGVRRLTTGWSWPGRVAGAAGAVLALATGVALLSPPVAATNVPRPSIGATPADVGLDATAVTLTTPDGVDLAGWWVPPTNGAALIVLHGAGSTRSDVLDAAAVLVDRGYGTLLIDARGHGDSGGTAMDFGWYGDADIEAATDFLADRDDVVAGRIGVVGMSMGGEEAIGATATNEAIRAVVAEGATGRSAADTSWLSDEYGWRGLAQEGIESARHWFTDYLTAPGPPTPLADAVVRSRDTRYLLIAAGEVADEQHVAARLRALAPDRVAMWTIDGAGHTGGLEVARAEWIDRVTTFLDAALLGR